MLHCMKCEQNWKSTMVLPIPFNEMDQAFKNQKCPACGNTSVNHISIKA